MDADAEENRFARHSLCNCDKQTGFLIMQRYHGIAVSNEC